MWGILSAVQPLSSPYQQVVKGYHQLTVSIYSPRAFQLTNCGFVECEDVPSSRHTSDLHTFTSMVVYGDASSNAGQELATMYSFATFVTLTSYLKSCEIRIGIMKIRALGQNPLDC